MHMPRRETVAIFGGGIAGMSAAQELAERGFQVTVYEASDTSGGKARSIFVPHTGTKGRRDLPGEHGLRFFPSFYKHVPDTMRRIPCGTNANGVLDNLVPTTRTRLARLDRDALDVITGFPGSVRDITTLCRSLAFNDIGMPLADAAFVGAVFLRILTSAPERRLHEYENTRWWDFIQAERRSPELRHYFADIAVRSLVAMCPRRASTRTIGTVGMQLWVDHGKPGTQVDRVLNGPTHDAWIAPWFMHLLRLGVEYRRGMRLVELRMADGRIAAARVRGPRGELEFTADHYLCALPLERMGPLVSTAMREVDPSLAHIELLHTDWMTGMQFFLAEDVPIVHGHLALIDSPWAITAISQKQFWPGDLGHFGAGNVRGVLSAVLSNWDAPGTFVKKPAKQCSAREIKDEVWAQFKAHLNRPGERLLADENLVHWFLADSVAHHPDGRVENKEPLFINTVGSWWHRPEAVTKIDNLCLASDYVRTNTDLATMESANEAARRAVNGILMRSRSSAPSCKVWDLEEPAVFEPLKRLDQRRFARRQPHFLAQGSAEISRMVSHL
jgi:15-cis-phytoene desaturase